MPKPPRQLDSRIEIITPENIALDYVLAGPFRRLPAYLIDVGIRLGMMVVVVLGATFAGIAGVGELGAGVALVSWFVLSWFYGGLFETYWNGQTPGKWVMRLRVLSVDGRPINALQAILRNVLRDVDAWPIIGFGVPLYMVGLVTTAANNRYQRLGDLASGTIVVVEKRTRLRGLAQVGRDEVLEFAGRLPASFTASRALSQALSAYVARRERFSAGRRSELARTLADPLIARFRLPPDTDPDLLLCAMYYRSFVADRPVSPADSIPEEPVAEVAS